MELKGKHIFIYIYLGGGGEGGWQRLTNIVSYIYATCLTFDSVILVKRNSLIPVQEKTIQSELKSPTKIVFLSFNSRMNSFMTSHITITNTQ